MIYYDSHGRDDQRPPVVLLHGLSFDRRHWDPVLRELAAIDPDRRVLVFDLPGHGKSSPRDSYRLEEVAAAVHEAVAAAGAEAPIVAGHSLGGALATLYGARHPARGVVNVDQPLLAGGFQDMLRGAEPVLRGPDYGGIWDRLLSGMGVDQLPAPARELVRAYGTPPRDLLLGYWEELLVMPADDLTRRWTDDLTALRAKGVPYHHVSGNDLDPRYRDWLTSLLPEAAVTVLPGSGHFPHLADPAALASLLAAP